MLRTLLTFWVSYRNDFSLYFRIYEEQVYYIAVINFQFYEKKLVFIRYNNRKCVGKKIRFVTRYSCSMKFMLHMFHQREISH